MPRYYIHLDECGSVALDEEGIELADLDAARAKATSAAREIMCAEVLEGRLCMKCVIYVEDADHARVLYLPFSELLTITGP